MEPSGAGDDQVGRRDQPALDLEHLGAVVPEAGMVVHAVVDDRPAEPLAHRLGQRGPVGVLGDDDRLGESPLGRQPLHRREHPGAVVFVEGVMIDIGGRIAGQHHLEDVGLDRSRPGRGPAVEAVRRIQHEVARRARIAASGAGGAGSGSATRSSAGRRPRRSATWPAPRSADRATPHASHPRAAVGTRDSRTASFLSRRRPPDRATPPGDLASCRAGPRPGATVPACAGSPRRRSCGSRGVARAARGSPHPWPRARRGPGRSRGIARLASPERPRVAGVPRRAARAGRIPLTWWRILAGVRIGGRAARRAVSDGFSSKSARILGALYTRVAGWGKTNPRTTGPG